MNPTAQDLEKAFSYDPETGTIVQNGRLAGYVMKSGYRLLSFRKKRLYAHRVAWCLQTRTWPSAEIDHINGLKDDNRWSNLREANRQENARNQGITKKNRSGLKGVSFHSRVGRWRAVIETDNGHTHLGYFETPQAASEAYRMAAQNHFGEFARI